jgi:hypothetical protein
VAVLVGLTVITLRSALQVVLTNPTPDGLWQLQKSLLAVGSPGAARARTVAQAFHACVRTLESKSSSRRASRWGAVLGTAAVAGVSLPEIRLRQERGLGALVESALPAVLEIGAAVRSAEAWEIEASLMYDEFAWFLYEELWDVSLGARPELSAPERTERIDQVLDPLLDVDLADSDRAALVVDVFRSVLAARVLPLLD